MFGNGLKNSSSDLRDLKRVGGLYSRIHLFPFFMFSFLSFFFFFLNLLAVIHSLPLFTVVSGFGAEREQLDEGAEEGVQPALVGHALLHHFLLTRVLSCLFNGVGLEKWDNYDAQTQTKVLGKKESKYKLSLCRISNGICAFPYSIFEGNVY